MVHRSSKTALVCLILCVATFLGFAKGARAASGEDSANAPACTQIPQINPAKNFTGNFSGPCYAIPLAVGNGSTQSGDPNAIYDQAYFRVNPGYELIVIGVFPNARFMSLSVYDSHLVTLGALFDYQILPQDGTYINPYLVGAHYKSGQFYGFKVGLGGAAPASVAPGCKVPANIEANAFDASWLHSGLTWEGYPNLPPGFPAHQTGPNPAGMLMVRKYVAIGNAPVESVIVRSLTNGCAVPAKQALQDGIVSVTQPVSTNWLNQSQIAAHNEFSNDIELASCFPADPVNQAYWQRQTDYLPVNDTAAGFINAAISVSQMQGLLAGQTFMRIRFKVPTTPSIPCADGSCSLTGTEQLRYASIALQGPAATLMGPTTLFAIGDQAFIKDPDGNVTLIFGFGAAVPPQITAANGYTFVDMTQVANYQTVIGLRGRNLLANSTFDCPIGNVPLLYSVHNPDGGYMGKYVPTVDFPTAAQLPTIPTPPVARWDTCGLVPIQLPVSCPVIPALREIF